MYGRIHYTGSKKRVNIKILVDSLVFTETCLDINLTVLQFLSYVSSRRRGRRKTWTNSKKIVLAVTWTEKDSFMKDLIVLNWKQELNFLMYGGNTETILDIKWIIMWFEWLHHVVRGGWNKGSMMSYYSPPVTWKLHPHTTAGSVNEVILYWAYYIHIKWWEHSTMTSTSK